MFFIRYGAGRMPGFPQLPASAMRALAQFLLTGEDTKVADGVHSQYPIEQMQYGCYVAAERSIAAR